MEDKPNIKIATQWKEQVKDYMNKRDKKRKEMEDITKKAVESIYNNLSNQMDEYLIEGLKRKGFEFDNRQELEQFIKDRCRAEEYPHLNKRTYFVDKTPFLLWNYDFKINPVTKLKGEFKVEGSCGSFAYL